MNFLEYDIAFLIFFVTATVIFLMRNKKNIRKEGKLMFLYPTKFGLNIINKAGTRYKKFFKIASYFVISTGYL